jgi:hypothetical protein
VRAYLRCDRRPAQVLIDPGDSSGKASCIYTYGPARTGPHRERDGIRRRGRSRGHRGRCLDGQHYKIIRHGLGQSIAYASLGITTRTGLGATSVSGEPKKASSVAVAALPLLLLAKLPYRPRARVSRSRIGVAGSAKRPCDEPREPSVPRSPPPAKLMMPC